MLGVHLGSVGAATPDWFPSAESGGQVAQSVVLGCGARARCSAVGRANAVAKVSRVVASSLGGRTMWAVALPRMVHLVVIW